MAQIGEGHEAQGATPQVLTFGSPAIGEILADRYQIESHMGDDTLGRQLFRGTDVVLRRPVTVVLRQPGGEAASEMLAAAVAASRVVHPHLVGVYDAIDEGDRAYVVREWIDGVSLRDAVTEGPVDAARAVAIGWAVADAVAALHATGVVHGNVHPATVMIAQDGRVMLADARADDAATREADIRAIAGVIYCALTSFWPHHEAGPAPVPDGVHADDQLVAPGQIRDGVPEAVDELVTRLLDPDLEAPQAEDLVAELAALSEDIAEEGYGDVRGQSVGLDAFNSVAVPSVSSRTIPRKLAAGIGGLVALAVVGAVLATQLGGSDGTDPQTRPSTPAAGSTKSSGQPQKLQINAGQVRVVDPSVNRGGDDLRYAERAVDGDPNTGWRTDHYNTSDFGGAGWKKGMGLLIDLGSPRHVANVQVDMSRSGTTLDLRVGNSDPGAGGNATVQADEEVYKTYQVIGEAKTTDGVRAVLNGSDQKVRYVMVFLTKLPSAGNGQYQVEVEEITVNVQ